MHTIESNGAGPEAFGFLTVESPSDHASIALSAMDGSMPPPAGAAPGTRWPVDPTKKKQVVSFLSGGRAWELIGTVPEGDAVVAVARRVVIEVRLLTQRVGDRQASQDSFALQRVVEVETPDGKAWIAPGWVSRAIAKPRVKAMDEKGRIT